MDLASGRVNELKWRVSCGFFDDLMNFFSHPQRGFVLLMTFYWTVSADYRLHCNHKNRLTTDVWVRRLLHLRQHLLECTDCIVVVSDFVQHGMFPLVAPWRRRIELDHLMVVCQWD